jgi:hypothetical protein
MKFSIEIEESEVQAMSTTAVELVATIVKGREGLAKMGLESLDRTVSKLCETLDKISDRTQQLQKINAETCQLEAERGVTEARAELAEANGKLIRAKSSPPRDDDDE